jgi:hypothetical protein
VLLDLLRTEFLFKSLDKKNLLKMDEIIRLHEGEFGRSSGNHLL